MSEIIPENNAEYNAFAKEVFSCELVPRCTVPIACTKAGKSIANRTGILFRVAGIPFLITAKHGTHADNLIIDIVDAGYRLFIPPDKPDGKMVAFGIRDFLTSNRDGTDHAVIELDEPTADLLEAEGQLFAGIRDVAPMRTGQSARSSYLVAGFPGELETLDAEGRKRLEWFPWLTIPWAPWYGELSDLPEAFEYNPEIHLLLSFEKDAVKTSGERGHSPNPVGMSGCGVWFVRDWERSSPWTIDQIRLVGIQSSWIAKHRCLQICWIEEALAMVWNKYPKTRDSFRLIGFAN